MSDILSMYLEDEDPRAQAQAMADVLSRQRNIGNMFAMTGDKVLGQFGQQQMAGALAREREAGNAMQAKLGNVLRKALAAEEMKMRGQELRQRALDRQQQQDFMMATLGMKQMERAQEKADKLGQEDAERRIEGYESLPGIRPSADAAKKGKDAKIAIDAMLPDLDTMISAFDEGKSGTELWPTEAKANLERARQSVSDRLRVFREMGVPNAKDYESLEKMLPDLTGWGATFSRNDPMRSKLEELRKGLKRELGTTLRALGYQKSLPAEHRAAVDWARSNISGPNADKAKEILELHGEL